MPNQAAGIFGFDPTSPSPNIALVQLADLVLGDTWTGIQQVGPITNTGTNTYPPHALASVQMIFWHNVTDEQSAFTLSSAPTAGQGTLTIQNSSQWIFQAPPQPLPLPVGDFEFSVRYTDSAGNVWTPMLGIISIIPVKTS